MTEAQAPYCRLYIDAQADRERVQALVAETLAPAGIDAWVMSNDGHRADAASAPYDPVRRARWTAELEGSAPAEAFEAAVCAAIGTLRRRGWIVVASCDFEDRVVAETGWNWSAATPQQPA